MKALLRQNILPEFQIITRLTHLMCRVYLLPAAVASVGYTEQAARDAGYQIVLGGSFRGNGKAIALGDDNGMIKTIFDEKTGELLGAHMIGPEVTELYKVALLPPVW